MMRNNNALPGEEKALKNRKLRIGTVATLITVGFIAAVVLLNVLLNVFVELFPMKVDVTSAQVYNLSVNTEEYLATVDKEVELILVQKTETLENLLTNYLGNYYKENYLTELFKNYDIKSDKISLRYVDPTAEPRFFSERNITTSTTSIMVVYCAETNRHKLITINDVLAEGENDTVLLDAEKAVTSAIIYVCKEEIRDILFLTGHEETGYGYLSEFFKSNGFNVGTVTLEQSDAFGKNTAALVICAPRQDFSENDVALLKNFMQNPDEMRDYNLGRTLYVILDNDSPNLPNFYAFLREYCIVPVDEYVVDISTQGTAVFSTSSARRTVLSVTSPFEATSAGISKKLIMAEQFSKSFELLEIGKGESIHNVDPILVTSENAYTKPVMTNPTADYFEFDASTDKKASRTVGALSTRYFFDVIEQKTYYGYVAVIGGAEFVGNVFMSSTSFDNSAFMKNLINTTIGDNSIEINVVSRDLSAGMLGFRSQDAYVWTVIALFALAVVFGIIALVIFIRRRFM